MFEKLISMYKSSLEEAQSLWLSYCCCSSEEACEREEEDEKNWKSSLLFVVELEVIFNGRI